MSTRYDVAAWLQHLPDADEEYSSEIVVEGWLAPSTVNEVRLVAGVLCLTFLQTDVLRLEQVESTDRPSIRTRMVLRRGATLLDARPAECAGDARTRGRQPFAIATRPTPMKPITMARFRELESDFLRRT